MLPPEFIGTIAVSPVTLRFSAMAGQAAPPSQTFTVTLGDMIEPAAWVASYSAPWLSVSPPTGSGSLDVSATINHAGLAPGTYQHTVQIEGPRLQGSPVAVTVELVVDHPCHSPRTLSRRPSSFPWRQHPGGHRRRGARVDDSVGAGNLRDEPAVSRQAESGREVHHHHDSGNRSAGGPHRPPR